MAVVARFRVPEAGVNASERSNCTGANSLIRSMNKAKTRDGTGGGDETNFKKTRILQNS
jgi:hypothetical protein